MDNKAKTALVFGILIVIFVIIATLYFGQNLDNTTKGALWVALIAGIFSIIAALFPIIINWRNQPPSISELVPTPSSPQAKGTSITWTVRARDPDDDDISYKFKLNGPSTGHQWKVQQDWSQKNDWVWVTNDLDIGNYSISAVVADKKHVKTEEGDDEKILNFVIASAPTAREYYDKGYAFDGKGQYTDALEALDEAIKLDPQYADAWSEKSYALNSHGKYENALQASEMAINLNPDLIGAWNNKAFALNNLKRYAEAIESSERSIAIDPVSKYPYKEKATAQRGLRLYAEALLSWEKAINIDPTEPDNWYNKSLVLRDLELDDDANAALMKARELGYAG